jgi:hypothetical protein
MVLAGSQNPCSLQPTQRRGLSLEVHDFEVGDIRTVCELHDSALDDVGANEKQLA